jgi:DNA-binding transcriptional MerR regulator
MPIARRCMELSDQHLSILEVSKKLKIPKRTLRFWEKEFEGLLVPLRTRGGQRRYTGEHLAVIQNIKALKDRGLSLVNIKKSLTTGDKGEKHQSNAKGVDMLADRVAEMVKTEICKFLEGKNNFFAERS